MTGWDGRAHLDVSSIMQRSSGSEICHICSMCDISTSILSVVWLVDLATRTTGARRGSSPLAMKATLVIYLVVAFDTASHRCVVPAWALPCRDPPSRGI